MNDLFSLPAKTNLKKPERQGEGNSDVWELNSI